MKKSKIVKLVAMILTVLVGMTVFNARVIEKRSVSSWVIEKGLWFSGIKEKLKEKSPDEIKSIFEKKEEVDSQKIALPNVSTSIEEKDVDGMQVFVMNDQKSAEQPTILYFHGGAYYNQPVTSHYSLVENLAKELDAKIVFPIYPKAPGFTYSDTYPKLDTLYREILDSTSTSDNITIMGDSAGGGLSLGFAMYARDHQLPQPKDIVLLSPWLDINTDNPEIEHYESVDPMLSAWGLNQIGEVWAEGKENMDNPYVSPIFGDITGLGKISIFVGTHEIFFPDNEKFHEILSSKNIEHHFVIQEKMNHVYAVLPIPEGKEAQRQIVDIIKEK